MKTLPFICETGICAVLNFFVASNTEKARSSEMNIYCVLLFPRKAVRFFFFYKENPIDATRRDVWCCCNYMQLAARVIIPRVTLI